jgi:hypothetical protein
MSHLKLISKETQNVENPTEEDVKNLVWDMDEGSALILTSVVEDDLTSFIQCLHVGKSFILDYREPHKDNLLRVEKLKSEDVIYIFTEYLRNNMDWKEEYEWIDILPFIKMLPLEEDGFSIMEELIDDEEES